MRKLLVDTKQEFGEVRSEAAHSGVKSLSGLTSKPCGATTQRVNEGHTHGPSFANQAPNAGAIAGRNANNPFAFTGHPKK